MAIDGNFSLEFALQRFLTRCPELRSRASFDSLSKQVLELNPYWDFSNLETWLEITELMTVD